MGIRAGTGGEETALFALDRNIEGEMSPLLDALRENDIDDRIKIALEAYYNFWYYNF